MKNKIHVHIGGQNEVCGFELAENETVGSLIKRLCKEGHLGEFKPEEWSVCVEDSDEELAHDCRLEHGKHHRIHICRCKKVAVNVIFNGATKTHSFPPGTTLRKVIEWARDKFGVDKKEKLVLRLGSTESEPLDPDSHVGSYVRHPHCEVTFYLSFLLQDFDAIEAGNFSSGLLCNDGLVGQKKTRHCAGWLDHLGFQTSISERKYTEHDRRTEDDPKIALCGFDRGRPRSFLGKTGFELIVECGLGDTLADFDQIHTHTFPSENNSPEALWGHIEDGPKKIEEKDLVLFTEGKQACGQIAIDMAGKAVSTSFVGAMAGAIVVAELLRVFNGGQSFEEQFVTPRNMIDAEFRRATKAMTPTEIVRLGFTCK